MNFATVIITCPGREASLEKTLLSYAQTDMGNSALVITDINQHERRQERQEHNSLTALMEVIKASPTADFILFCEDDIIFNRHLRHNLENWAPLKEFLELPKQRHFFGSLYDPTIREQEVNEAANYFIADPDSVYGSQCFVMSRIMALYFIAYWWEVPGMQDIKMSRLAARLVSIYYHAPSLVQHVGVVSAWGGPFHDTKMFDGDFKA